MKEYNIRPATNNDLSNFSIGKEPPRYSCKVWAIEYDGAAVAIFGLLYAGSNIIAFSEIYEDRGLNVMTKWRIIKDAMDILKKNSSSFCAINNGKYLLSGKMLEKLGFEFVRKVEEVEVYLWQTQVQ